MANQHHYSLIFVLLLLSLEAVSASVFSNFSFTNLLYEVGLCRHRSSFCAAPHCIGPKPPAECSNYSCDGANCRWSATESTCNGNKNCMKSNKWYSENSAENGSYQDETDTRTVDGDYEGEGNGGGAQDYSEQGQDSNAAQDYSEQGQDSSAAQDYSEQGQDSNAAQDYSEQGQDYSAQDYSEQGQDGSAQQYYSEQGQDYAAEQEYSGQNSDGEQQYSGQEQDYTEGQQYSEQDGQEYNTEEATEDYDYSAASYYEDATEEEYYTDGVIVTEGSYATRASSTRSSLFVFLAIMSILACCCCCFVSRRRDRMYRGEELNPEDNETVRDHPLKGSIKRRLRRLRGKRAILTPVEVVAPPKLRGSGRRRRGRRNRAVNGGEGLRGKLGRYLVIYKYKYNVDNGQLSEADTVVTSEDGTEVEFPYHIQEPEAHRDVEKAEPEVDITYHEDDGKFFEAYSNVRAADVESPYQGDEGNLLDDDTEVSEAATEGEFSYQLEDGIVADSPTQASETWSEVDSPSDEEKELPEEDMDAEIPDLPEAHGDVESQNHGLESATTEAPTPEEVSEAATETEVTTPESVDLEPEVEEEGLELELPDHGDAEV